MKTILTVIGARPQIIKAAAISRAISTRFPDSLREYLVHTGQHYDHQMSQVFFEEMGIPQPHYNLQAGSGSHGAQTARMIEGLEKTIQELQPDAVLVYGDTNSTLAASVVASKLHYPVIHIEAGLRSFDKRMPEEINRIVCDHVSSLLFSPTLQGVSNLAREGVSSEALPPYSANNPGVFHCGDIMLDNTLYFSEKASQNSTILEDHGITENGFVLSTVHRDSNTDNDERLASILSALCRVADEMPVVFPVHPRTQSAIERIAEHPAAVRFLNHPSIQRLPPVSFLDMIELERASALIITDSGGVQKEAFFLRRPGIVLRPHTEWVEIVDTGHAILADADEDRIVSAFHHFRQPLQLNWPPLFGDGKAAEFICEKILGFLS